jgi:3-oxoacyl-[acyl-carrier-protein] synthase-3
MLGKEVFKHAVEKLSSSLLNALKMLSKNIDQIDWVVPHQANQRIITAVADKLKINHNKIISTVSEHGNTSAASIPLALDNAVLSGKIVNGNLIAFQAIGGGLSWGASLVRIGQPKNI